MASYRQSQAAHYMTSPLTKLYSDTKKSASTSVDTHAATNEQFPNLHRKYRIQKDRFITWGLAWSDEDKGSDGGIDDAVAKAGLTETVDSVLRNIKDVIEEVEAIQQASLPQHTFTHTGEKVATSPNPAAFDPGRYQDLLNDLTTSIDTLYDLSRSRRAIARGEHPSFTSSTSTEKTSSSAEKSTSARRSLLRSPSFASSDITLVNPPSFQRPALSPYAGLPPQIELSALRLPEEGPPPYEALGVPSTTRFVGQLIRAKTSTSVQNALGSDAAEVPVFVEYANFDSIYRDTHVSPPLQRLEALAGYLQPMRPESQSNLSLLGYFEDPSQPRIGLVYDVPYSIQNRLQDANQRLAPVSLLKLVQKASKTQPNNNEAAAPALEHRFQMAYRLVEQLYALHACEVPHGNINSSSIIFTMRSSEAFRPQHARAPLLASFDLFSKCTVEGTQRAANFNIYRHPDDTVPIINRAVAADIRHDLYALALVLLEVGLWTPIGDLYKQKYTLADFKLRIEKLWIPKLAAKCGSTYMRAVEVCFRAVDDPMLSNTSISTDNLYQQLLPMLRRCCLLDEPDDEIEQFGEYASVMSSSKAKTTASYPGSPFSRLNSAPGQLLQTKSAETTARLPFREPETPRLASKILSSTDTGSLMFNTGPRSNPNRNDAPKRATGGHVGHGLTRSARTMPSFKEYKQKVILIQQSWRQYRASRKQAIPSRDGSTRETHETVLPASDVVDKQKPKRQRWPCLELPQCAKQEWEQKYCYQLLRLCERALKASAESSNISLTMYGETPETAKPTFLITCEKSTAKIKQTLKRHFRYDTSMYDIRVKGGEYVRRCRRSKAYGDSAAHRSMAITGCLDKAANPDYQERPICGASIGAYRDDEHLPPVSFGGVILVDGKTYGMSVHHMLESNADEDQEDVQAAEAACSESDSDSSSIGSPDSFSVYSHSDDETTIRPPSSMSNDDDTSEVYEGDVAGIAPDDYEDVSITQPALDDAIECDLHVDEDAEDSDSDSGIDEDHLLSYRLGQIHASSGLKRSATSKQEGFRSISQSLPQEIDWALFELVPPRAQAYNVVRGGMKYCSKIGNNRNGDSYPVAIKQSSELACAKVHCIGRTSGLGSGTISSTMELVKIHGRSTFSASWTVDGDFGVGGDSGAWVISNEDGRVCGHVLASKLGRTFICPMDLLLADIKETLGATTVELPIDPRVSASRRASTAEAEKAVEDSLGFLKLGDDKDGGVALPASPVKRSMAIRPPTAVEIAG
ncbi:hypothetical protein KC340_g11624 [Hortaea werneckii]|nr:hypothetical protein KC342_g4169 [Hortaea werneckii]KAI7102223.1 hypothetical protein KC339_g6155 [Hortaea werneckii]KAI7228056.1 hypothetical protein KC365_g8647 [Hortaea werneckii]KAI7306791.1 hypothetical protein KC340_g11624 [Hortaea werneckii]KAI7402029.1 hypothetical protein KC328_g2959 [Hortaea werneckii]